MIRKTTKFAKVYLRDKNSSLRTQRLIIDDDDKLNRKVRNGASINNHSSEQICFCELNQICKALFPVAAKQASLNDSVKVGCA